MTRQIATGVREVTRASAWSGFSDLVTSMGGNPTRILAAAHLDAEMLVNPERFLPIRQLIDTLAIAADRLKRKDFDSCWARCKAAPCSDRCGSP